jgi:hypothetical protein
MKQEDLTTMAERCRSIAEGADTFTKKRLLDLALKYEARSNGRSLASQRLVAIGGQNHSHHGNGGGNRG